MKTSTSNPSGQLSCLSKFEYALRFAHAGLRVFPLPADDPTKSRGDLKKAFLKNWPELATTDGAQIRKWWAENPDFNIGIATGSGLVVLDYDVGDGKLDRPVIHKLVREHVGTLPRNAMPIVETASGGLHIYLRLPPDVTVRNSASKLAPHVDTRGDGGYVVAPGSTIHGKPYQLILGDFNKIAEIPSQTLQRLKSSNHPRPEKQTEPVVELDTEESTRRAERWIRDEAPQAIEGQGGDATTYQVACRLKDFGLSEGGNLEVITIWNELKAIPPWSIEELQQKVANAYQYGTSPPGISDPRAEFEPVPGIEIKQDTPVDLWEEDRFPPFFFAIGRWFWTIATWDGSSKHRVFASRSRPRDRRTTPLFARRTFYPIEFLFRRWTNSVALPTGLKNFPPRFWKPSPCAQKPESRREQ